jgi:hypothetical protein
VTFNAPERADTVTVTATGTDCTATIVFQVIEPSGVLMEVASGTYHVQGQLSCGFNAKVYIQPDTVSFRNIMVREQDCMGVGTGYFEPVSGQISHHPNANFMTVGDQVDGKGSQLDGQDTVKMDLKGAPTPYSDGTFTFAIPWEFRVGSAASGNKVFATVNQVFTLDSSGTVTAQKDNSATVTAKLNDPSSSF